MKDIDDSFRLRKLSPREHLLVEKLLPWVVVGLAASLAWKFFAG